MLRSLLILIAVGSYVNSQGLEPGPEPGEGEQHPEKKQTRRNFLPGYPFLPIYIPYRQVVEVHHVVMLQAPTCMPGSVPSVPGTQPGQIPSYQPGQIPPYQPGQIPSYQPGQIPSYQPGQIPPYQPGQIPPYQPPQFPPFQPGQPPFQPQQPPTVAPTTSPGLDNRMNTNTTMPKRPSRCVWAIVACCSPDSNSIRYSCFELLGCPGAFWGVNPCESTVVQAAANTALNFYMSGGEEPPAPESNNDLR